MQFWELIRLNAWIALSRIPGDYTGMFKLYIEYFACQHWEKWHNGAMNRSHSADCSQGSNFGGPPLFCVRLKKRLLFHEARKRCRPLPMLPHLPRLAPQ